MMEIELRLENVAAIKRAFDKAPLVALNEFSRAVDKSIKLIERNLKTREAPVNKQPGGGSLRQNIESKMVTKLTGEVASKAPYTIYVHQGTRPHIIRTVNARVLANKRTGQFFGKVVHHPGTRPNPFMVRALESAKKDIGRFIGDAIANVTKTLKG